MPELPEVETICRYLEPDIIGKIIKKVTILEKKQFIGKKEDILEQKIKSISRFGKVIVISLNNKRYINIHLKLTGELLFSRNINHSVFKEIIPFTKTKKMPGSTTRIIVEFTNSSVLFFNDLRKFGWLKVTTAPEKPKGIDVLSRNFNAKLIYLLTRKISKSIKLLLMDQDKITGIGNIYANDALFLAKIHPLRSSKSLNEKEIKNLHQSIMKVINDGLKDKGSSGADEAFILPDGTRGNHQKHFLVYQQENKPCIKCRTIIKRIKHGGRSSFFCPVCQII